MIEINGVNKSFGSLKALDNIIATIQEGSIFGLVGTNGAGKSTLLRILCGVLKADTGAALIDQGKGVFSLRYSVFFSKCHDSDDAELL